jgi:hypothetical protein
VCSKSTDPEVRGALVKYQAIEETIRMLRGSGIPKEQSENE